MRWLLGKWAPRWDDKIPPDKRNLALFILFLIVIFGGILYVLSFYLFPGAVR